MIDVAETMEKEELKTARGRREEMGREINISKDPSKIFRESENRRSTYISTIERLKDEISECSYGIDSEELEAVEFLIEQLERLARYAGEYSLEHIGKGDERCRLRFLG